jgi:hypothetical protein
MSPPAGKRAFGGQSLDIKRPKRRPRSSKRADQERRRMIDEFIIRKGITRCPPGYSRVDL